MPVYIEILFAAFLAVVTLFLMAMLVSLILDIWKRK